MIADDPITDIEVVDMLFANVIAAEPDVMIPVTDLTLEIAITVVATVPNRSTVDPVGPECNDIANLTAFDALDGFNVTGLMASLGAGGDLEAFLLRELGGLIH